MPSVPLKSQGNQECRKSHLLVQLKINEINKPTKFLFILEGYLCEAAHCGLRQAASHVLSVCSSLVEFSLLPK